MDFNASKAKKGLSLAAFIFVLALPGFVSAQMRQFQHGFSVGSNIPVTLMVIGYESDSPTIDKMMGLIERHAKNAYAMLDWRSSDGDISRLNSTKSKTAVSPVTLQAMETALDISNWTKGAFDVTQGSWRKVKLDKDESTIEVKNGGIKVNLDPIIDGVMADYIVGLVYSANMHNAIVKVGMVFRSIGRSMTGPWKIQVSDAEGTYAHHAVNLTIGNAGSASISRSSFRDQDLVDPRTGNKAPLLCRGVTIVSKEAAMALGLARAIFLLGPQQGLTLLNSLPNARGMIVDNNGRFLRSNGF